MAQTGKSQLGLKKDAPEPAHVPGLTRLYHMRFCPFSQRVQAVLAHKGIQHEVVNIDLMSKPTWMGEKNPNLEVPIMERGDMRLTESLVICEFLEEIQPEPSLMPKDPLHRAHVRMLIAQCAKVYGGYFALMQAKGDPEKTKNALEMMQKGIQFYENKFTGMNGKGPAFKGDFMGGNGPCMADYMLYPWFERFEIYVSPEMPFQLPICPESKFPKMAAWYKCMRETQGIKGTPEVPGAMQDLPNHIGFIKTIMMEKKFNYDFGLPDA